MLPDEIWILVFQFLHCRDVKNNVLSAILVCRHFQQLATPVLYGDIAIGRSHAVDSSSSDVGCLTRTRERQCLARTLQGRPELCALFRGLSITMTDAIGLEDHKLMMDILCSVAPYLSDFEFNFGLDYKRAGELVPVLTKILLQARRVEINAGFAAGILVRSLRNKEATPLKTLLVKDTAWPGTTKKLWKRCTRLDGSQCLLSLQHLQYHGQGINLDILMHLVSQPESLRTFDLDAGHYCLGLLDEGNIRPPRSVQRVIDLQRDSLETLRLARLYPVHDKVPVPEPAIDVRSFPRLRRLRFSALNYFKGDPQEVEPPWLAPSLVTLELDTRSSLCPGGRGHVLTRFESVHGQWLLQCFEYLHLHGHRTVSSLKEIIYDYDLGEEDLDSRWPYDDLHDIHAQSETGWPWQTLRATAPKLKKYGVCLRWPDHRRSEWMSRGLSRFTCRRPETEELGSE